MGALALLILPLLLVGIAGIAYVYKRIMQLMSKSAVRNKVIVITDAISGLGKECSRVFHSGGGRVVLCGNDWEKLEALQQALIDVADPSRTFSPKLVLLDLSETGNIPEVAKEILESYGCVDVLINNSSLKVKGDALNVTLEMDKKIMDANYFGPISLTKELLPSMISRHNGQIVLVNSIQGKLGLPFRSAYAASKHAIQAFFDCLRAEVAEFGITVSTVSPTFIRSYHQMPEAGNWEASIWKFFFRKWAYGVHPVEVAEEVLYTVNRGSKEVMIGNPMPKAFVFLRTFCPEIFFAIVAAGISNQSTAEEDQ
ncbi:dehydrogenase/reductase (SDR family) member 7Cb [Carcharodon carcharias]|uniref:dehydrogenase/reductase (SDR family) member 7Cb n=1 Tax=Carcharodon carcharias TaxID=13397 RepID=UPI001B7E4E4E|nr:dehydrogenase/reductase (SDR family) member 7Cb [Carcharodon carcharias]XP_041072803.1 dehydrogenase/reductase (SDR family) member 7Cb [Carcharodon carcharias]XP_041072804.1 dehydrogenase/reductase (SDR family) member 7Cb [Carcharodon carcharias]XP_041072805.1 dehydrogenase/reductase (SDR family) member 7Cb [Carcharodon carcharias]XP_041072806.1 dehydrogenase/reductase (SDR family) member 7Cb [Carcharodon carcharias]